jgi:hypothetical protein
MSHSEITFFISLGGIPVLLSLYKSQYFIGIYIIIIFIVYVENYL